MKHLIVIPTYNEARNIEDVVNCVFRHTKNLENLHILVVDDSSPDGTPEIVNRLKHEYYPETLHQLIRPGKSGLGSAYVAGFQWGIQRKYNNFVEMDADFSHNPRYLPAMLTALEKYHVAVGSRYVAGGAIKGWGIYRKVLSRFGSLYAKAVLGVPVNDLTGGFNAWRREVLEAIGLNTILSEGYAFQIELKFKAFQKGFYIGEIPIVFEDRVQGKSKLSKRIVLEAIFRVWQFRFSRSR